MINLEEKKYLILKIKNQTKKNLNTRLYLKKIAEEEKTDLVKLVFCKILII